MRRLLISSIVIGGLALVGCGGRSVRAEQQTACNTAARIGYWDNVSEYDRQAMLATLNGATADLTRDVADYNRGADDLTRDDAARRMVVDCFGLNLNR